MGDLRIILQESWAMVCLLFFLFQISCWYPADGIQLIGNLWYKIFYTDSYIKWLVPNIHNFTWALGIFVIILRYKKLLVREALVN